MSDGPPAGRRIGPFTVIAELGRGGMGAVYRARHDETGAEYALKVILPVAGFDDAEDALARFQREAELHARLEPHANLVRVLSVGGAGHARYCAMELVDGESLEDRARRETVPLREAARLIAEVSRGVAHAHRRAVLHRDIKPANVVIDERGTPRLIDFGLALDAALTRLTETGISVGTPAFMAPEQVDPVLAGAPVGPASDVYGLGATLYMLLTGRPPFGDGRDARSTLTDVVGGEIEPPSRHRAGLPPDLEAVCLKALARHPDDRYASADALADDLQRWRAGTPVEAAVASPLVRGLRRVAPSSRWQRFVIVAGTVLLVSAAALGGQQLLARVLAVPLPKRVSRLESRVDLRGFDEAAMNELAALRSGTLPPEVEERVELLERLERLVAGSERDGAGDDAAALARLVRPGGEIAPRRLDLCCARLIAAEHAVGLDAIHHGESPVRPAKPSAARIIARALADGEAGLSPPPDAGAFDGLLRAAPDRAGRLWNARARERSSGEAGPIDLDAALEAHTEAALLGHPANAAWSTELHVHAVERIAEAFEELIGATGGEPSTSGSSSRRQAPDASRERIHRIGDLLCRAPGQPRLSSLLTLRLQTLLPYDVIAQRSRGRAAVLDHLLLASLLDRYGAWPAASEPTHARHVLVEGQTLSKSIELELIELELKRPPERRNPFRLIFLAIASPRDRDPTILRAIEAAEAIGSETTAFHTHMGFLHIRTLAKRGWPDADATARSKVALRAHRKRAIELNAETRWPRPPLDLFETGLDPGLGPRPSIEELAALVESAREKQWESLEPAVEISNIGGLPSSSSIQFGRVIGALGTLATLRSNEGPELGRCDAERGGVDDLVRQALELERDDRVQSFLQISREVAWYSGSSIRLAAAAHHQRHGRLDEAFAAALGAVHKVEATPALFESAKYRRQIDLFEACMATAELARRYEGPEHFWSCLCRAAAALCDPIVAAHGTESSHIEMVVAVLPKYFHELARRRSGLTWLDR